MTYLPSGLALYREMGKRTNYVLWGGGGGTKHGQGLKTTSASDPKEVWAGGLQACLMWLWFLSVYKRKRAFSNVSWGWLSDSKDIQPLCDLLIMNLFFLEWNSLISSVSERCDFGRVLGLSSDHCLSCSISTLSSVHSVCCSILGNFPNLSESSDPQLWSGKRAHVGPHEVCDPGSLWELWECQQWWL